MDPQAVLKWQRAIQDAPAGDVLVQQVIPDGQAATMGIFDVGDRLQGVGELPLGSGGFERVVRLLQDQPRSSNHVTLHFDRKSALSSSSSSTTTTSSTSSTTSSLSLLPAGPIEVVDQGAWSSRGTRQAQEDAFVLHELHDTKERSILLAGIMDGHLGQAASNFVKQELPKIFSEELVTCSKTVPIEVLLERSWERVCHDYQSRCLSGVTECVADYDAREGLLLANTGSVDAIAGTTCSTMVLGKQDGRIAFLNCGDSRALLVDAIGRVQFQTKDHTLESEVERFLQGKKLGFDNDLKVSLEILAGRSIFVSNTVSKPSMKLKWMTSTRNLTHNFPNHLLNILCEEYERYRMNVVSFEVENGGYFRGVFSVERNLSKLMIPFPTGRLYSKRGWLSCGSPRFFNLHYLKMQTAWKKPDIKSYPMLVQVLSLRPSIMAKPPPNRWSRSRGRKTTPGDLISTLQNILAIPSTKNA